MSGGRRGKKIDIGLISPLKTLSLFIHLVLGVNNCGHLSLVLLHYPSFFNLTSGSAAH